MPTVHCLISLSFFLLLLGNFVMAGFFSGDQCCHLLAEVAGRALQIFPPSSPLLCVMLPGSVSECTCVYISVYSWRMTHKGNGVTTTFYFTWQFNFLSNPRVWIWNWQLPESLCYAVLGGEGAGRVFFQWKNPLELYFHYLVPFHILYNSVLTLILF